MRRLFCASYASNSTSHCIEKCDAHEKTRWIAAGFSVIALNHFSLISLYSTCLRAFGSNFMIDIFSGIVFLFLLVV